MENHFYHIKWAPLSVIYFITHVRILRNGSYANAVYMQSDQPLCYSLFRKYNG